MNQINEGQPRTQFTPPPAYRNEENMWAMLCHLSTFLGFVFPMANIIAPLVIWITKKDEYPLVDDQGKEAINFQISITIYIIASIFLIVVIVGIPLLIGLGLFSLIATIIAAIRANEGERFRYPATIRFIL